MILELATLYVACGTLVAALFVARWRRSFDPSAAVGSWGFCVLIVPGIVALWPVILMRVWRRSAADAVERPVSAEGLRRSHRIAFITLAILAPLIFAIALIWRAPEIPRSGGSLPPSNANGARLAPLLEPTR